MDSSAFGEAQGNEAGDLRVDDRRALVGILVILRFAIPWKSLLKELECGSGSTCRRCLLAWEKRGVWEKVWHLILDTLGRQDRLDLRRVAMDGSYVPGEMRGETLGSNPPNRGRKGTIHNLAVDARGVPIAVALSPANVHDCRMLIPVLYAIPPIPRPRGRPRSKPVKVRSDKRDDYGRCRQALRERRIIDRIARRRGESKRVWVDIDGWWRWRLPSSRLSGRLQFRYKRSECIHKAFLVIGCIMICWRALDHGF